MAVPCPKCKADLPKGVKECPSCGAKLKKKKKKKPAAGPPDTGTTKRIVRKKSAIPSFDDSQVIENQAAEFAKYKEREAKQAEAQATGAKKKKKQSPTGRRRKEQRNKLEDERAELSKEKERLKDERARMAAEQELEEEREELAEEKKQLADEKQSRKSALEKKKQAAKSRRQSKGKAQKKTKSKSQSQSKPNVEQDEDLPGWDDGGISKPKSPTRVPAKKSLVGKKEPAGGSAATAVADGEVPEAVTVLKAESVGEWVGEIKDVDWKKIGIRFGIPAGLLLMMMLFWGRSIAYGVIDLPKIKARQEASLKPERGGFPYAEPPMPKTHAWLPLGPIRIRVPLEGPIYVNWERRGSGIKAEERVILVFKGWMVICELYKHDALFQYLNGQVPDSMLEPFVGLGADKKLIAHILNLTPADYSYFQGPGGMRNFMNAINLKLDLFPEIKRGMVSCDFGSTSGYFFGEVAGQGPQRFELFDAQGTRFSYLLIGGGPNQSKRIFKLAQPSQGAHWRTLSDQFQQAHAGIGKKPFALLQAAMWAAGGSMGSSTSVNSAKVNEIRSYLAANELNPLGGGVPKPRTSDGPKKAYDEGEAAARKAFEMGHAKKNLAVYRLMLRLMSDPRKFVRLRMRKYFKEVIGYAPPKGMSGIGTVRSWVELQEKKAREAKNN